MSKLAPPIPLKNKQKTADKNAICFGNTLPHHYLKNDLNIGFCSNLNVKNYASKNLNKSVTDISESLIHIDSECTSLKLKDRELMEIFMCIHEVFQFFQGNIPLNSPDCAEKIKIQRELFDDKSDLFPPVSLPYFSNLEPKNSHFNSKISFESHFNIPHVAKITKDFLQSFIRSDQLDLMSLMSESKVDKLRMNFCEINVLIPDSCFEEDIIAPPIPCKKSKSRLEQSNSTFFNNKVNECCSDLRLCESDKTESQIMSMNKNGLEGHMRQSSITLSDFYDHLHPKRNQCSNILSSLPSNTQVFPNSSKVNNHNFPKSRSEIDCKASSIGYDPKSTNLKSYQLFSASNCNKMNNTVLDGRLKRADSTPLLSNELISEPARFSKISSSDFEYSKTENKRHTKSDAQTLSIFPNVRSKLKISRSKMHKKHFTFFTRGFLHTSQNVVQQEVKEYLEANITSCPSKSDLNLNEHLTLDTNIGVPPPIPPKMFKLDKSSIEIHQTWC